MILKSYFDQKQLTRSQLKTGINTCSFPVLLPPPKLCSGIPLWKQNQKNKIMKKLFLVAITSVALFASSCKKSCPDPVTPPDLSGTTWTGTANVPGLSLANRPFVLNFNADGTLTGSLTNGAPFAINGTWNLTPNTTTVRLFFTLVTVAGSYIGQAILTTSNTKLESGVATNATSPTANLNFTTTKS
jgi:hypothetical protein